MASCTIQVNVDNAGNFTYVSRRVDTPLKLSENNTVLNVKGQDSVDFTLVLSSGTFVGLRAQAGSAPARRDGWTEEMDLDYLGMGPSMSSWPPSNATSLSFNLNVGTGNANSVFFGLWVQIGTKKYFDDPKIYNDPTGVTFVSQSKSIPVVSFAKREGEDLGSFAKREGEDLGSSAEKEGKHLFGF
jgi:hypothetical protein